MNFRIQELLKVLVPGCISLTSFYWLNFPYLDIEIPNILCKELSGILLLIFLSLIYVSGYFVDWIGSLIEFFYYRLFPRPSYYLLNNYSSRFRMLNAEKVVETLCEKMKKAPQIPVDKKVAQDIFKYANVQKDKNASNYTKERLIDSYYSYIFSRNMMSSFLLTFLIYILFYLFHICDKEYSFQMKSLLLVLFGVISSIRWREHSFYYSRQVFYAATDI